jgi:hypothetical protein
MGVAGARLKVSGDATMRVEWNGWITGDISGGSTLKFVRGRRGTKQNSHVSFQD